MCEHGKHLTVDVSRGWGARASSARDETEHAAATHGTVAHRRDREDAHDGDRRAFAVYTRVHIRCVDIRVATVVPGALTRRGLAGGHRGCRRVEFEQVSGTLEIRATGGTEETIVPDFGEATWQHVLEEARDERVHRERHAPGLVGARVGVAEGDATMREGFEPVIGEGHVIDVAREIARRVRSAPDLWDVHGPPACPHGGIDRASQLGPLEGRAHLRATDRGEHVPGHEEARVRRLDPCGTVGREPARGDEEMRVRMVLHRARPRVEDREDAERAADPGAIVGERSDGGRGSAEKRGVDHRLVDAAMARNWCGRVKVRT